MTFGSVFGTYTKGTMTFVINSNIQPIGDK